MPGLDGRQLYEKLRARDQTKKIPFIFMASKTEIEERLRQFSDGVEDYIVKPFFLREVVARAKKITDRLHLEKLQTTARRPGVIEGRLEEMNVIDLFQSLEMGSKSCRLTLTKGKEKCEIFLENGQVYDAVVGQTTGDEAVYKAVEWNEGAFEIDFSGKSEQRRTTRSTQGLLMEALRLLDESRRDQVES
jgi:YesN/AraC family two-component response regulator